MTTLSNLVLLLGNTVRTFIWFFILFFLFYFPYCDEVTPSWDSLESLSNRCSTDWNSQNVREIQRKTLRRKRGGGKLNHSHSSKLSCTRLACLYIGEGSQKTEKKKGTPSNRFLTAREKKENNFGQQFLTAKERHIWREK